MNRRLVLGGCVLVGTDGNRILRIRVEIVGENERRFATAVDVEPVPMGGGPAP
jgi:hypothetical protein